MAPRPLKVASSWNFSDSPAGFCPWRPCLSGSPGQQCTVKVSFQNMMFKLLICLTLYYWNWKFFETKKGINMIKDLGKVSQLRRQVIACVNRGRSESNGRSWTRQWVSLSVDIEHPSLAFYDRCKRFIWSRHPAGRRNRSSSHLHRSRLGYIVRVVELVSLGYFSKGSRAHPKISLLYAWLRWHRNTRKIQQCILNICNKYYIKAKGGMLLEAGPADDRQLGCCWCFCCCLM